MVKMKIDFEGFNEVITRLSKLEGDTKKVMEEALEQSKKHVQSNLTEAMRKHNRTHRTVDSIDENSKTEWTGTIGKIDVGFNIKNGGLPSIFLMYGTPKMKKDQRLYNAIYGKKTRDEVHKIQEDLFYEAIRKAGG